MAREGDGPRMRWCGLIGNRSGVFVDVRALTQRQACVLQLVADGFQNPCRELMLLQQAPEIHDRRVFGNRRAERQSSKLACQSDFVQ